MKKILIKLVTLTGLTFLTVANLLDFSVDKNNDLALNIARLDYHNNQTIYQDNFMAKLLVYGIITGAGISILTGVEDKFKN